MSDLCDAPCWVRVTYTLPRDVQRIRPECRNAKLRFKEENTIRRWKNHPDYAKSAELVRTCLAQGEIGRYEGVRIIMSNTL